MIAEQQPVREAVRRHFDDERAPVLAAIGARDDGARREADLASPSPFHHGNGGVTPTISSSS